MLSTAVIAMLGVFALIATHRTQKSIQPLSNKVSARLQRLWDDASQGIREKKYLKAERSLLTILKFDQKNAPAYNRLGILYAKQKDFKDAIHCFEVASSIEPSASSLHNLGLIYFETKDYEKAERAFEEALQLEDGVAARHIAFAKVQEKLGDAKEMVRALEKAAKLEKNPQTLLMLADAYEIIGKKELAKRAKAQSKKLILPTGKPRRVSQERKVVM